MHWSTLYSEKIAHYLLKSLSIVKTGKTVEEKSINLISLMVKLKIGQSRSQEITSYGSLILSYGSVTLRSWRAALHIGHLFSLHVLPLGIV